MHPITDGIDSLFRKKKTTKKKTKKKQKKKKKTEECKQWSINVPASNNRYTYVNGNKKSDKRIIF